MRNMCLGITAFAVTMGMVAVSAQGRNFSGTWVIDSEKTMAAAQAAGETENRVMAGSAGGGGRAVAPTGGVVAAGGGGGATESRVAVARGTGGATGGGGAAAGSGGRVIAGEGTARAGVGVAADMVITMDATTFTVHNGPLQQTYSLTGQETTIQVRSGEARARASWKGDMLVIEQTVDTPNGPSTSSTSWFLEGDSLVRLTSRKTYFKKK